jgi:hypothetical protein
MLAMRVAVLGGLGGHGGTSLSQTASATPRVALDLILGVAIPDTGGPRLVAAVGVALGLLLAVVSALLVRGRPSAAGGGAANPPNPPNWLGVAVGASCIAMLALTYAGVGWIGAWYYMLPALGWAIALAALFAALLRNVRGADGESAKARAAAAGALALLLGSSIGHARLTPYFHRYGEWQRATAVADDFLQELSARIVRASPGDRIDGPPLPMWVAPREGIPHVRGAAVLSDYSVQAWAHLVHPDRRVRVLGVSEGVLPTGPPTAAAGEIVVALPRRMVGY